MICGPHLTMDPGSLSRALKYGRYCLPSLKDRSCYMYLFIRGLWMGARAFTCLA